MSSKSTNVISLDEPAAVYHAGDADSNSKMGVFDDSPQKYNAFFVAKTCPKPESDKVYLQVGTATHSWILEPDSFHSLVKVIPAEVLGKVKGLVSEAGGKNTNLYKEFEAANPGKVLLKRKEYDEVRGMRDAVLAHPAARILIDSAIAIERSIYWTCRLTGLDRKMRLDLAAKNGGDIWLADLKSTRDSRKESFRKQIHSLGYDRQARYYLDGWTALDKRPRFAFIAVEKSPPHVVRLHEMDESWIAQAGFALNASLKRLAKCHESDDWTEPTDQIINELSSPKYAYREY